MKTFQLDAMVKGWLVGAFDPAVYHTNEVEVGVKTYTAGEQESAHFHKIATEITVIVSGEVRMNGLIYKKGDIIVIEPNDVTDFFAITDSVTTVVKIPGALNDKYLEEEDA